jgi:hypothetical protein
MKTTASLFFLLVILAVSACSIVPPDKTQFNSKLVTEEPKEALNAATIIVLREPFYGEGARKNTNEQQIETCIKNKIREHNSDQRVIEFNEIAGKLFPDLSEKRIPRSSDDFSILLDDEKFYTDVSAMGIRYLIFVGELSTNTLGEIVSEGGPFGGFALSAWGNETRLSASILDIHQRNEVLKKVEKISTDMSWLLLIGGPLPIPIGKPSFATHNACNNIGNKVGEILLNRAKQ